MLTTYQSLIFWQVKTTLTWLIIVQQSLLIFQKISTYTLLLGSTTIKRVGRKFYLLHTLGSLLSVLLYWASLSKFFQKASIKQPVPRVLKREDKWPTVAMYGHGFPSIKNWWPFCSEQLHRHIIHQNAQIFKRNWLIPSPPAISI